MDKKQILIIAACLAFASLFYGVTASFKPRNKGILASSEMGPVGDASLKKSDTFAKRCAKRSEFNAWGRDPFSLEKKASKQESKLELRGIVWDEKNPQAIINGDIVRKGDQIGNNRVVEVKRDVVVLNDGTKDFTLGLE
jgi:hypothetical protein